MTGSSDRQAALIAEALALGYEVEPPPAKPRYGSPVTVRRAGVDGRGEPAWERVHGSCEWPYVVMDVGPVTGAREP